MAVAEAMARVIEAALGGLDGSFVADLVEAMGFSGGLDGGGLIW